MSDHYFKIAIALNKTTNKIADAVNVPNGGACNCYCYFCKEDLIAANAGEVRRPHFKHKANSNCDPDNESYIHWVTKEIFRDMKKLKLPSLNVNDAFYDNDLVSFERSTKNWLVENGIIVSDFDFSSIVLQSETEIDIDSVEIEKTYKSKSGNIKVDIVLNVGGQEIFIEPYLSNVINEKKFYKLNILGIPTISINLFRFITKRDYSYSISDLKTFLFFDTDYKKWEFVRKEKSKLLREKFNIHLSKRIEEYKAENKTNGIVLEKQINENISQLKIIANKIKDLQAQYNFIQESNKKTREEIVPFPFDSLNM